MSPSKGEAVAPKKGKKPFFKAFLTKLRKRRIIETLAAFIAGGWLVLEFVDRILVAHYELNKKWLDVSFVTLLGALLCITLWRWFSGTEKRPGNVKVEVLLVPLIILVAMAIDLNLILQMAGIPDKKLLIGIVAFLLGIAWVIFKLSQWAASTPDAAAKKFDISKLADIKPEKSIVVLPFADLSPQKDQEYFCDGMTEEIITDLSHIHDLLVISRNSAMTFKGTQKTTKTIAGELNVQYVLEGSVRKAGNDLRIAAQLINAETDTHIWAEKYSGTLGDVFDMQEKVSRSIMDALRLKLSPEEQRRIAERPIDNIAAYEWYMRATGVINMYNTEEGYNEALRYFEHAISTIGDNALIYSGMAYAHFLLMNINVKMELNRKEAEKFVHKALALDPGMPKARALLGYLNIWYRGKEVNQKEGVRQFKMALTADPSEPMALLGLLFVHLWAGRRSPAIPLMERYRQVEPVGWANYLPGAFHFYDGQYELALQEWRKWYRIAPYPGSRMVYVWALAYNKQISEALAIIEEGIPVSPPNHVHTKQALMLKHALQEDKKGALQELTPDFYDWCRREGLWSYHIASDFALLNAKEEALDWLENAVDCGHINYPLFAEKDPFLANIRSEERFKKLMERVKYEWEHFEV
jgi:TolB-like protein